MQQSFVTTPRGGGGGGGGFDFPYDVCNAVVSWPWERSGRLCAISRCSWGCALAGTSSHTLRSGGESSHA